MVRKGAGQRVRQDSGAEVRLSVSLPPDTHSRLRTLALLRRCTAGELVAGWITSNVARVRLGSEGGDPADPAA